MMSDSPGTNPSTFNYELSSAEQTTMSVKQVDYNSNPVLTALPNHLRQFVVEQNYDQYTSIDHAVWRFIMRQNVYFLKTYAHQVYFDGLLSTGISFERIPRIEEMNEILSQIGWGAVAVDGFIPPAAFMEFQAHKVLVIAADMRQLEHIEYTPAPDIVHEAAGHAPIIVDVEYAEYLRRFGEIGAKAMSSKEDFELYKAIRHLSILKEAPDVSKEKIDEAEQKVEYWQANLGVPSEMALLSRLHWWTVEYGLIGKLHAPKIYGAGLLSSIGEASSCLDEDVRKLFYNINARDTAFDITTKQPQLFVTPDFSHLTNVLEEFESSMAFKVGGNKSLQKAITCENVSTVVYSSGLQISGIVSDVILKDEKAIYLKMSGPSALAVNNKQLDGHGKDHHKEGFGSPIGKFKNCPRSPELLDNSALNEIGLKKGLQSRLEFESGVVVIGVLKSIIRSNDKLQLLTFENCMVTFGDQILFQPEWGMYDMAVGGDVISVFHGAADKDEYDQIALVPRERTIKVSYDSKALKLHNLYQQVREIRENKTSYDKLDDIWKKQQNEFQDDWLLSMDIYEILETENLDEQLKSKIKEFLVSRQEEEKLETLITWGLRLIDFDFADVI